MSIYSMNGSQISTAYKVDGIVSNVAYDVLGNQIHGGGGSNINYDSYTVQAYCGSKTNSMQGFDIYNGVIFQCTQNNLMTSINASTQSVITSDFTAYSDHGDSASFSNEFYSASDTYPLLYITSDTTPAKVYVNRVTTGSAELVRTYTFPQDKTGYWAALAYDTTNNIMYMVGYKENSYISDNGGSNKMIVSKWNPSNAVDNGDGTLTPEFISNYERPFIYVAQGQQFHDGMIWVASGYYTDTASYIYAIEPATGATLYTIDLNSTKEVEGLSFISDTEMVVGLTGGTGYKKYTFARR